MTQTKEVKDLYDKNFKSLKKEIKEDLRRWKDLPCSWIDRINIVKNGPLSESTLQIQCNLHKIPTQFFTVVERTIFKLIWNNKNPRMINLFSTVKELLRESSSQTSGCITE